MAKKKYVCIGCHKCTEPCTVELSGDADMTKDPNKMLHCGTWLEVPAEEDTNKEQLPKLTADVFSLDACPLWARYAAVDENGRAYWYDEKPMLVSQAWEGTGTHFARPIEHDNIVLSYDASDWKTSLLERPTKKRLPKLTTEVFSFRDCPDWAQYAAADADGAAYWYAAKPDLGSQAWCNISKHFVARRITLADVQVRYDKADWKSSLIARPAELRTKLTYAVFSLPECPEWAQFAAVDSDGVAYWYDTEPEQILGGWLGVRQRHTAVPIARGNTKLFYDSSDWKNSLIERFTKLTEEIFNHPDCPADAVVAVVNASGTAAWGNCADITPTEHGAFRTVDCCGYGTWTPIPGGACFDATDWEHSAVYRRSVQPKTTEPEAPKLTHEVLSYSTLNDRQYMMCGCEEYGRTYTGCPGWARYAAVNKSGEAYVYENKPVPLYTVWTDSGGRYAKVLGADKHELQFDATDWKNSLIERPAAAPLPKLTVDVFARPQCPDWARYAAVDADGVAWYYGHKPRVGDGRWDTPKHQEVHAIYDNCKYARFNATDWEHSLIERPSAVPKWFKPGVLAYNSYTHTFLHVTDSTEYHEKYLEAKVRQYNDNELESLFGQSVLGPNGSKLLVTGYCAEGRLSGLPVICVLGNKWLTAEELLTYGSRPQGIQQYHSKEGAWIDCGLDD